MGYARNVSRRNLPDRATLVTVDRSIEVRASASALARLRQTRGRRFESLQGENTYYLQFQRYSECNPREFRWHTQSQQKPGQSAVPLLR